MRVTRVDAPVLSSSVNENVEILAISSRLSPVAVPVAALAAKNCATIVQQNPQTAIAISNKKRVMIYVLSPVAMPLSIIAATIIGTTKSKHDSSILNSGAIIDSILYFLKYGSKCFIFYNVPLRFA